MVQDERFSEQLSERALTVFKGVVDRYLADGRPVASSRLARELPLGVSSATVRNVLADLESAGLLATPHTSAGRVPTTRGLRMFVDTMLTAQPFEARQLEAIRRKLDAGKNTESLLTEASNLLAGLSAFAGVVLLPRTELATLKQIEFLGLSEQRVLAILVTSDGNVHNWVVHTRRQYGESELQKVGNFLTAHFAGSTMPQMRRRLVDDLKSMQEQVNEAMAALVDLAEDLPPADLLEGGYVVRGESNLITAADHEPADMSKLRGLMEAFAERRDMLQLLDHCMNGTGVQIFIGSDSGYRFLDDYSLVSAPYEASGEPVGVLGVIGPTCMPYDRVVSVVDVTAKLLGAALEWRD